MADLAGIDPLRLPDSSAHPAWRGAAASMAGDPELVTLVQHAQAGDSVAFEQLVSRFQGAIRAYLARLTGDQHHAEDLTQEVLWTAWNRLLELREPAHFRAWIFRVATNRARSWLRRQAIRSRLSLDWLTHGAGVAGDPSGATMVSSSGAHERLPADQGFEDRLVDADALAAAVRRVPLPYRACLLLHLGLGFTVPEVAEQLDLSPGAVRMRLSRGLAILRQAYQRENA